MNKSRLIQEIEYELIQLKRLSDTAVKLNLVSEKDRQPWDAAAAAKYISDLVIGLENLCKRRNAALDRIVPEGPEYHQVILDDFLQDDKLGGRLDKALAFRLKKYLRFRHRFVHSYGHEIDWLIIEEPLRLLPETITVLTEVWKNWLKEVKGTEP
ncbi:hypothetical protein KAR34_13465 [bacterium]|nr:hypothetical protein [bacterium]